MEICIAFTKFPVFKYHPFASIYFVIEGNVAFKRNIRDIIIFDEAASALNNLTEVNVMKEVWGYLSDITVLAIVHCFTNIWMCNHIFVFRDGKIVGQGTFDERMKRNEYFAKLYYNSMEKQGK